VKNTWLQDTLDPDWGAKMDPLQWNGLSLLCLEVWDFDKHTGNDSLGQTVLNLEGIPDSGISGKQVVTCALQGPHALPNGTVTVELDFTDLRQW
jgi:hypothetical protein